MTFKVKMLSLISVVVLATASCGGSSSSNAPSQQSAAPSDTSKSSGGEATESSDTTSASNGSAETGSNLMGGNSPEDFLMPDVVCMNLQEAQDEIQDHGVFFSRSEDASGRGRSQLIDSNWIVVGQTPAVGTKIGEGDAVLSVVKIGESTNGVC